MSDADLEQARLRFRRRPASPSQRGFDAGREEPLGLGVERDGLLYVPDGAEPGAPVLVFLHGATGTGRRQMDRIRELAAAFETHESELLALRRTDFEQRFERNESVVRVSLIAAIAVMLGAGVLLVWHTLRRVRAERAVEKTFSLLRSTIENVSQGVAVFNSRQRLIAWNAHYAELRGLNPLKLQAGMTWNEILGMGARLVVTDQTGVLDGSKVPGIMAAGEPIDVEGIRADGAVLQLRGQRMHDGNYIVTYTDVTALKLSETAHRDQAARLSAILDGALDGLAAYVARDG